MTLFGRRTLQMDARRRIKRLGILAAMLLMGATLVRASDRIEVDRLVRGDSIADDRFGASIATDGTVAVVGRIEVGFPVAGPGSAFVYRFNGVEWVDEQQISASDGASADAFGGGCSVDGDVVAVGAPDKDGGRGAVYVFRYDGSTWVEEQKLTASDAAESDRFGVDLELDGDVLFIGAPNSFGTTNSGYIFRYDGSTWVEEQKLTPGSGSSAGFVVALEGDVAILANQTHANFSGRAIVFRYDGSTWLEDQVIVASDPQTFDFFGRSVSLQGSTLVIGAAGADPDGAAYVFREVGGMFIQEQKLTPDADGFEFGIAVALDGDEIAVGSWGSDNFAGAAYTFTYDGTSWTQRQKLSPSIPGGGVAQMGTGIELVDGWIFAAAVTEDGARGATYVFHERLCLAGVVNAANGRVTNSLFVNGSSGGSDRLVQLGDGEALSVSVQRPVAGGNGRFVLHVNEGAPGTTNDALLPAVVGRTCFPFLLSQGAAPVIVANNIGKESLVGASHFYGTLSPDPPAATTTLAYPDFPIGTTLTLQAVILDPGALSTRGASATNAVVVQYVP